MIERANAAGGLGITKDNRGPDKPATNVSWDEVATFVNWLNTSTGHQPAYKVNGNLIAKWQPGDAGYNPANVYRNNLAKYFLPSTHEWYKAAFYNPTTGGYFRFPTGTNHAPRSVASGTEHDTAVWSQPLEAGPADVSQAGGLSPYGTMGQGGNVWEWEETDYDLLNSDTWDVRGLRGGFWNGGQIDLGSTARQSDSPFVGNFWNGFRIASVALPPLPGDYNEDGVVDAGDYTVWRDRLGDAASLPNDDTAGVEVDDYTRWKQRFGTTVGSGSIEQVPVPEPGAMVLVLIGAYTSIAFFRR